MRDMIFQCAIFQTSAALETYLKLLIEGWAQSLKQQNKGDLLPLATRGFLAARRFQPHFDRFGFYKNESELIASIPRDHAAWPVLNSDPSLPHFFDGKMIHANSAYPSIKNIIKLLNRVGIDNPKSSLDRLLRGDVETLVEGFQSIRTALAHSSPPSITFRDVQNLLADIQRLVSAIDRLFYRQVVRHGGISCWT